MRIRRRQARALLILLPAFSSALATVSDTTPYHVERTHRLARREAPPPPDRDSTNLTPDESLNSYANLRKKPVDGLDGKPKSGPFIETSAGKERKKPAADGDDGDGAANKEGTASKPLAIDRLVEEGYGAIPMRHDGVMDDPHRVAPKEGTTGTEGGVSEKERGWKAQAGQMGEKLEKKPDPPKEAPPLPHSEQERIARQKDSGKKGKPGGKTTLAVEELKGAMGLEKPTELAEKPHDDQNPLPPKTPNIRPPTYKPKTTTPLPIDEEAPDGIIQPFHSFILSLTMILFSEIGDKTFLVAALMAMRHPRLVVFSSAFSALIAMTVLSAVLGHAVPTLIPERYTRLLAAILFLVFGAKMLREGYAMDPNEGVGEEMKEVEMELEEKEYLARRHSGHRSPSLNPYALEAGHGHGIPSRTRRSRSATRLPSIPRSPSSSPSRSPSPSNRSSVSKMLSGVNNLCSLILSPAWVQTFVMTFLGEWGDRSQIATIAMAAGQDYWWVTGGAISGHAVCTAVAVIGGRAIAGRVSMRVVTLGGAVAFLVFGGIYLLEVAYLG